MSKEVLFNDIQEAILDMDEETVVELCKKAIRKNIPPQEIITNGLIKGMDEMNRLFEEEEFFIPEVLMCSDAFYEGFEIVREYLDKDNVEKTVRIVMGVVEGDTHDIGKNLVKILIESSGIEVYDLGRDVQLDRFIEKAEEIDADIIGMSALMTTTMEGMKTVIDKLTEMGIRDKYKIMIGGGSVSQAFANKIGADIYTRDAIDAARKVKELISALQ